MGHTYHPLLHCRSLRFRDICCHPSYLRYVASTVPGCPSRGTTLNSSSCAVDYLYREKHKSGVAITLIVLYLVFFLLTLASYLRTYLACKFSPGLVPLSAARKTEERYRQKAKGGRGRDIEQAPWHPPDSNPDSPGLEAFYSKDVFVCELDGRPKWCSDCRSWKPDRARHSSEINRCIRKMDHICPWVGGAVSETCEPTIHHLPKDFFTSWILDFVFSLSFLALIAPQPSTFLPSLPFTAAYTVPPVLRRARTPYTCSQRKIDLWMAESLPLWPSHLFSLYFRLP